MRRVLARPGTLFIVLAIVALSSLFVFSPRSATDAQNAACCSQGGSQREIVFPYFSLANGFNSTLMLVSDSPNPLNFILAIHNLAGQTELSSSMTIQPGAKMSLDMGALLTKLGADVTGTFAEGSVSVYFEGTVMPLVGQMTIENPTRHWVQQAEMMENDPGSSDIPAVLSGIWWGLSGGRDARVMVTNASANTVTADVFLDYGGQRHKSDPLVFSPNETKVVSITELLSSLGSSPSQAPAGGITIIQREANPSLVAQGRVDDPVTGFSTTMEFPDSGRQGSSSLDAVGLPIGTPPAGSPYAGDGTFTPHVIARNLLSQAQTMTVTIRYPLTPTWNSSNGPGGPAAPDVYVKTAFKQGEKNPNDAIIHPPNPDPSTLTGHFTLAPLTVGPDSTVDYSLAAVIGQLPSPLAYCSIHIQYSGAPGSLIAQTASVDSTQDLVVGARTANEGDGWAGSGANPWHVDKNTQSILFLTDESDEPARIGFVITVGDVHYYLTRLKLAAHETRAINIAQLRDEQRPDFKGHKIPSGATDGSVNWIRLDNVPVSGRVAVIQKQTGTASSYDCYSCYCGTVFTGSVVLALAPSLLPGHGFQQSATCEYRDCNYTYYWYDETDYAFWGSSDNSLATVNDLGYVSAVGAGSATISAIYWSCEAYPPWYQGGGCGCSLNGSGTGTNVVDVQHAPAYVSVGTAVADTVQCGSTSYYARRLRIPYTVVDSSKSPVTIAGLTVQEHLSWSSSACATSNECGQEPSAGTWSTSSSGGFTDTIYNCSATCENGGTCSEDWQQTFTVNGSPVGIVNGSTVGTLNCIATDCSSTPQGTTH